MGISKKFWKLLCWPFLFIVFAVGISAFCDLCGPRGWLQCSASIPCVYNHHTNSLYVYKCRLIIMSDSTVCIGLQVNVIW